MSRSPESEAIKSTETRTESAFRGAFDTGRTESKPSSALSSANGDNVNTAAAAVLSNKSATAQEKLQAVEKLASLGFDSVEFTDADGTKRKLRLELEHQGSKLLVHAFANDENGKERVVLRGISDGKGKYSSETDANGRQVGLFGTWWSAHMQGKSALVGDGFSSNNNSSDWRPDSDRRPGGDRRPLPPDLPNLPTDQYQLNAMFDQLSSGASGASRRIERLPNGALYFRAGMAIDADGSPRARRIDPTGSPHTSLRYEDGSSVNAENIPFIVMPGGSYKQFGAQLGDIAAVRYNGKVVFAIFADVGPRHKIGEGSMALAEALGINSSPTRGGVSSNVEYVVFPGSGDRTPGTVARTYAYGAAHMRRQTQYA